MGGCILCLKPRPEKLRSSDESNGLTTQSSSSLPAHKKQKQIVTLDDFQPLQLIGKGTYGKVVLVRYLNNNKIYAMKILKKEEIIKQNQVKHAKIERLLLEKLDHPFLAKLHFSFQNEQSLFLVTEFMQGGELYFHLKKKKCFKESTVKFYMAQIFLAIDYMHKNGYIYRDLKPENILLDKEGYIKLTDFGLSKIMNNEESNNNKTYTMCGTLEYIAPEILKGKPYDKSVDWFSFGIVLYELICGELPFTLRNSKFDENVYDKEIEYPTKMSKEAKDLISNLLQIEPEKRLGYKNSDEIKNSAFFKLINFDKMYNKEYIPSFRPKFNGKTDLKYFDIHFTEDYNFYDEDFNVDNNNNSIGVNKTEENIEKNESYDDEFKDFSFTKEEDEKGDNESDEDDDMSL